MERDNLLYWLWLSLCFPPGSHRLVKILAHYTPFELYQLRQQEDCGLSQQDLARIRSVSLERAQAVLTDCERRGVSLLTLEDDGYPQRLLHIPGPPPVLYFQGNPDNLNAELVISVVGTRRVMPYYREITTEITRLLAEAGIVIVSGCAVGCDEAAHQGALLAKNGRTVGVLACGFGVNYPQETLRLRERMLEQGGTLISELPPMTGTSRHYFATRNRLISGLSTGVLLSQVPVGSGALLTARHALEQGRDLYCLPPCDIRNPACLGVADLLRDGIQVVCGAGEILSDCLALLERKIPVHSSSAVIKKGSPRQKQAVPEILKPRPVPLKPVEELSELQQKLLELLEKPRYLEELSLLLSVDTGTVMGAMTELEMLGYLCRLENGLQFQRVDG